MRLPKVLPSSLPDADRCRREGITRWEVFPRGMDNDWAYAALGDGAPAGAIVLEATPRRLALHAGDRRRGRGSWPTACLRSPPRPREAVRGEAFVRAVVPALTDSPWWAWFTTALGLVVGCAAAWLTYRGLNAAAGWLSRDRGSALQKLGGDVVGPSLRSLAVPIGLVLVVLGLLAGTAPAGPHPPPWRTAAGRSPNCCWWSPAGGWSWRCWNWRSSASAGPPSMMTISTPG